MEANNDQDKEVRRRVGAHEEEGRGTGEEVVGTMVGSTGGGGGEEGRGTGGGGGGEWVGM